MQYATLSYTMFCTTVVQGSRISSQVFVSNIISLVTQAQILGSYHPSSYCSGQLFVQTTVQVLYNYALQYMYRALLAIAYSNQSFYRQIASYQRGVGIIG